MKTFTNLLLLSSGFLLSTAGFVSESFAIEADEIARLTSAERLEMAKQNFPESLKYPSKNTTPIVNGGPTVPITNLTPFFDSFELGNFWGWLDSDQSPSGQKVKWRILSPVPDPIANPTIETCVIPGLPPCLLLFPDDSCLLPPSLVTDQFGIPQPTANIKYYSYVDTLTYSFVGENWAGNPSNQCGGLPGAHSANGKNSGSLVSPSFDFTGELNGRLRFDTYWEIEGVDVHNFDLMYLQVSINGPSGPWAPAFTIAGKPASRQGTLNPVNDVNSPGGTPYANTGVAQKPKWANDLVDLRPFVQSNGVPLNNTLNFRFYFDTIDQLYNGFRSWHIDNVEVTNKSIQPATITKIVPSAGLPGSIIGIEGINFVLGSIVVFKSVATGTEYPATAGAGTGQGGQSAVLGSRLAQAVVPNLGPFGNYEVIVRYGSGTQFQQDANSANAVPIPLYFEHTNVPPTKVNFVTSAYESNLPDTLDVSPVSYPTTPLTQPLQGTTQFVPHGDSVLIEIHGQQFVQGTAGNEFIARPWLPLPPPVGGTSDGFEFFTPITFIDATQVNGTFNNNWSQCHIPGNYRVWVKNPAAPDAYFPPQSSGMFALTIYNPRPQIGNLRFFTEGIQFLQANPNGWSVPTDIWLGGRNFDDFDYCDTQAPGYNPFGTGNIQKTLLYIRGVTTATGDTIETNFFQPDMIHHHPQHLIQSTIPMDTIRFTLPAMPAGVYDVYVINPDGAAQFASYLDGLTNYIGKVDYEFSKIAIVGDLEIIGDVDGNQSILADDSWDILRHVVGLIPLPNAAAFTRADVDSSNSIQAADAAWILKRIANIVDCFPATHQNCALPKVVTNSGAEVKLESTVKNFLLSINAKGVNSVNSAEFTISYNPNELEIVKIEPTDLTKDFSIVSNPQNGILKIAMAAMNEITEDGNLIQIYTKGSQASVQLSGAALNSETFVDEKVVPNAYALEQNYPNPFNPKTNIRFSLPENAKVDLKIYNALGQTVKTLVNTNFASGSHVVEWNGTDANGKLVSSGVYFYQLKSENFTQTKKMLFLK